MKSICFVTALVGVASAHVLAREADDISDDCREVREAMSSANRPQATVFSELSLSHYETASRTATLSTLECAWVTEVPESAYPAVTEAIDDQMEWLSGPGNFDLSFEVGDKCVTAFDTIPLSSLEARPCGKEWDTLLEKVIEKTGWEPLQIEIHVANDTDAHNSTDTNNADADDADADDTDDPEGNMARPGFQTSTVAVLLATALGAVALL